MSRGTCNRSQLRQSHFQANRRAAIGRACPEALEDRRLMSFAQAVNYAAGASPQAIGTADFNDYGRLDLAVANSASDNVSVLLGNVNGTFQAAKNSGAGDNPLSIAWATSALAAASSISRSAVILSSARLASSLLKRQRLA